MARGRFPVTLLYQALHHSKMAACKRAPRLDLLQGRDVRIIDGTTLRLADTPRNQRRFPQPSTQAKGCGFPAMKVLALFCLRSGAALNAVTSRPSTHDTPLARKLWPHLHKGDVLLGDRAFGDLVTMALLPLRGVDVVAYNLARVTMIEAACRHGAPLDRLSFKGTVDGLRHDGPRMARARSQTALRRLRRGLFHAVAQDLVPKRPGRREPRSIQRRPKPFAYLTQPRHLYRDIPHRNRWNPEKSKAPASPNAP